VSTSTIARDVHRRCARALVLVLGCSVTAMSQSTHAPGALPAARASGHGRPWEALLDAEAAAQPGTAQSAGSSAATADPTWKWKWKKKFLGLGQPSSIAVDAQGHPHVFYSPYGSGMLHAWSDGVHWFSEAVDPEGGAAVAATDADGTIHIAYGALSADEPKFVVRHARKDGDTWMIETVDTGGYSPSIAIDERGAVHIVHLLMHAYGLDEVRHVRQTPMGWQSETIDTTDIVWDGTSLAVDGATVYATYSEGNSPATLRLATRVADAWTMEDIGQEALDTSLATDADGVLHVVYHSVEYLNEQLVHAWRAPSGWQYESLVTWHDIFGQPLKQKYLASGNWPTMTRDSAGRLYLAFGLFVNLKKSDAWGSALAIAELKDGIWVPRKFGPGLTGFGTAIAVARSGIVHAATGKPTSGRGGTIGTLAVQLNGRKLSLAVNPPEAGTITDELTGLQCTDSLVERIYPGTDVTLVATPAPGYAFVEWAKDGTGPDSSCQVTLDKARKVEARFEPSP
jgi:hypothetical protein